MPRHSKSEGIRASQAAEVVRPQVAVDVAWRGRRFLDPVARAASLESTRGLEGNPIDSHADSKSALPISYCPSPDALQLLGLPWNW